MYNPFSAIQSWILQRQIGRYKIGEMLNGGVPKRTLSERASLAVFASKKDGILQVFVEYRRSNAITVRGRYAIPQVDEYINLLELIKDRLDIRWHLSLLANTDGRGQHAQDFVCHQQ